MHTYQHNSCHPPKVSTLPCKNRSILPQYCCTTDCILKYPPHTRWYLPINKIVFTFWVIIIDWSLIQTATHQLPRHIQHCITVLWNFRLRHMYEHIMHRSFHMVCDLLNNYLGQDWTNCCMCLGSWCMAVCVNDQSTLTPEQQDWNF